MVSALKRPRVVTHAGPFHADELFGVAVFCSCEREQSPRVERLRRDRLKARMIDWEARGISVLALVDIGGESDPARGRFDHHQRGFDERRANGLLYASFGLVWRALGERWMLEVAGAAPNEAAVAAEAMDRLLVQTVDASDTGATFFSVAPDGVTEAIFPATVAVLAGWRVPLFGEPRDYDRAFRRALPWAEEVLRTAAVAALDEVRAAAHVAESDDGSPLLVLGRPTNWFQHTRQHHRLVLFPGDGETPWYLQTVPMLGEPHRSLLPLPAAWAGLRGMALERATGVKGAVFCHSGRWIAGAATQEAAMRMAEIALSTG